MEVNINLCPVTKLAGRVTRAGVEAVWPRRPQSTPRSYNELSEKKN